jgi:toxin ParE1/3/4
MKDNPSAAQRAVAAVAHAIQSLGALPERGRPVRRAGARELIVPFGKSAYIVRYGYSPQRQEVIILRIWHGREARE